MPARGHAFRREWVAGAALVVATIAAYAPAIQGELLLDDDVHVTAPELRSVAGLGRIWSDIGETQQYYPVLHTAFWLQHRLWGEAPAGYHLTGILLHACAALLVVAIVRRLKLPGGWLAGFLFALHPVAVESVAWISEQKNTLSTVFYLGAAWAALRFHEERKPLDYAIASGLFLLALLSKTATATLPAALLLIFWWRRGRIEVRSDVVPLLPWFLAAAGAGLITIGVERELIAGIDANLSLSGPERTLVAGRALWFYLANVFWPANLSFLYQRWTADAMTSWAWLFPGGAVALAAGLGALARRSRGPLAAFLFFAGTLFPVLGFIDVQWFVFAFVADHFQYVANLGVIIPAAAVVAAAADGLAAPARRIILTGAATVVVLLASLTWRHSANFRDNITLYTHAAARTPDSVVAHYLLGTALAKLPDRLPDAIAAYSTALRLNPGAAPVRHQLAAAHFDLARLLSAQQGRAQEAAAHYEKSVQNDPDSAEAHYNLANALLGQPDRHAEALGHYEAALRLRPAFAEADTNYGVALARIPGRLPEAVAHFESALRANPDFTPARNNLRQALQALEAPPQEYQANPRP